MVQLSSRSEFSLSRTYLDKKVTQSAVARSHHGGDSRSNATQRVLKEVVGDQVEVSRSIYQAHDGWWLMGSVRRMEEPFGRKVEEERKVWLVCPAK